MTARLGVDNDGKIVGLDCEVLASAGAYPAIGAILPLLTQMMSVGVYEVPKVRFDAKTVLTNNTTVGAYRGAGRPEATQLIERVLDVAADQIGIDPAEIRRINFMRPDTFPRTTITGANYDSGEYEKALDAALDAVGLRRPARRAGGAAGLRRHQAARHRRVGVRRGHRARRPAHRVGSLRGEPRRFSHRVRRHQCPRPRAPDGIRDAGQRRARHPDGQDHARQLRHVPRAARFWHPRLAFAADRRQRHPRRVRRRARTGEADRRRTCSRPRPKTSWSATAAYRWLVCPRRPCRGRSSRRRRRTRRSCPTASNPERCATSSTSTAPIPRSMYFVSSCRSSWASSLSQVQFSIQGLEPLCVKSRGGGGQRRAVTDLIKTYADQLEESGICPVTWCG